MNICSSYLPKDMVIQYHSKVSSSLVIKNFPYKFYSPVLEKSLISLNFQKSCLSILCPIVEFSFLVRPSSTLLLTQARMPLASLTSWAHTGSCPASVNQHHQVFFHWESFQPLLQPVVLLMVLVTQGQDPALHLVDSHALDLSPLIQPVQSLLQSLPTL